MFYSDVTGKTYKTRKGMLIGEFVKQRWDNDPDYRAMKLACLKGKRGNRKGAVLTDDTKELMSRAKKGVSKAEDHKQSMRPSAQRRWAAIKGEAWAVHYYLANDKPLPELPEGWFNGTRSHPTDKPLWDAAREAAIRSFHKKED